ncbi:MAG: GNAT family N-acetyltransferase [Clostridiales bacterium]|nr:GNAT family N-acetyltransferase [Clostridiales bacterium]
MLTHRGTVELHTERLRLRRYALSDAQDMFEHYAADPRVTRFLTWPPYEDLAQVRLFLEARLQDYAQDTVYNWAIEYGGQMIGSISVTKLDESNACCEVGYCIGFAFWNRGIVSEALATVLRFLFDEVGMRRVVAQHDAENPASGRVMLHCGMTCEGRLREHYLRADRTVSDALIYGILRSEFKANTGGLL